MQSGGFLTRQPSGFEGPVSVVVEGEVDDLPVAKSPDREARRFDLHTALRSTSDCAAADENLVSSVTELVANDPVTLLSHSPMNLSISASPWQMTSSLASGMNVSMVTSG
jgi:hypothetical protein